MLRSFFVPAAAPVMINFVQAVEVAVEVAMAKFKGVEGACEAPLPLDHVITS